MSDKTEQTFEDISIDSTSMVEPKKRRGRPPKNPAEAAPKPEADRVIEIPKPEELKPVKRKSKKVATVEDVGKQIYGLHAIIAMMSGIPEVALQPEEAASLAKAVITFGEEFDFQPNPKIMAAITLFGTAAMIYVPRVPVILKRVADKKAMQGKPKNENSDKTTIN
jgi:hypothetical protein